MERSITRRQSLVTGSIASLAAIAGCSGLGEDEDESDDGGEDDTEGGDGGEEVDPAVEDVDHENPDGGVAFVTPEDGDEVTAPVEIEMEVEEFELQPTDEETGTEEGEEEDEGGPDDGAGHMHVIVNHGCVDPEYVIPDEEGYYHLDDGGTEAELDLEPGEYDLCAQASDDMHAAYDLTDQITIEVVEGDGEGGNDEDGE